MSIHNELNQTEIKLSKEVSKRLGFNVLMYRDGNWICQPYGTRLNGYGSTPEEAEKDCKDRN